MKLVRHPAAMPELLVEFFVPAIEDGVPTDIASVRIHAHVMTDAGTVERQEITFDVRTPLDRAGHEEPAVRREVLVLAAARAREEAVRRERAGDRRGASEVLLAAAQRIAEAPATLAADLDDERLALAFSSEGVALDGYSEADRKYEQQRSYNARRGKQAYDDKLRRPR